jgi:imidazolonepropionase-like amidohydrolase
MPGEAIHRELGLLVEAGLTPLDAIRAATAWASAALGAGAASFKVGGTADFFGAKGDPLQNIGDLTNITTLVRAGEVLDREELLKQARRATSFPKK